MKAVESYVSVTPSIVESALLTKNFLPFQGGSILFLWDDYKESDVVLFLESVFTLVNKVAVEGKNKTYSILSNKYDADSVEPFLQHSDVSDNFRNDVKKIAAHIADMYTEPYAV